MVVVVPAGHGVQECTGPGIRVVPTGAYAGGYVVAPRRGPIAKTAGLAGEVGDLVAALRAKLTGPAPGPYKPIVTLTRSDSGGCLIRSAGVPGALGAGLAEVVPLVCPEGAGLTGSRHRGLEAGLARALECRGCSNHRGRAARTPLARTGPGGRFVCPGPAGRTCRPVRSSVPRIARAAEHTWTRLRGIRVCRTGHAHARAYTEFVLPGRAGRARATVVPNIPRVAHTCGNLATRCRG
eukprot:196878-Hanusia_phi.AAC.2